MRKLALTGMHDPAMPGSLECTANYAQHVRGKNAIHRPYTLLEQQSLDKMQPLLDGRNLIGTAYRVSQDNNMVDYIQSMYVTFSKACTNLCNFCRNEELEYVDNKSDYDALVKSMKAWRPHLHEIAYGGGDPLVFLKKLMEFRKEVVHNYYPTRIKEKLITSGIANLFMDNKDILNNFSSNGEICISRHNMDDSKNHEIFGGKNELLTLKDLIKVKKEILLSKMTLKATCSKENGMDSEDILMDYIAQAQHYLGANVVFNDLDPVLTEQTKYVSNQIDDSIFFNVIQQLLESGHYEPSTTRVSKGFDVTTLKGDKGSVGFMRYHATDAETLKQWGIAGHRAFNLSMMQDGSVYDDERNTNLLELNR